MLNKNEIKDKVDYKKFYSEMIPGIRFGTAVSSPFREDKHPSFVVYENTGIWKDFATGDTGDIFNFVEKKLNLNFKSAKEYLFENYTRQNSNPAKNKSENTKKSGMKNILKAEHQQMIDDLQSGKFHEIEKQIVDRRLSKEVLLKLEVGAGIFNARDKDGNYQKCENFVFPFETDGNGDIVRYKRIPYKEGIKIGDLIRTKGGATIFPKENQKYSKLVTCEGELDVVVAEGLGIRAVTVTGGAGVFKSGHADFFVDKDVILLYDNDKPGRDGQKEAAEMLSGIAKSVKLAQWDKDIHGYDFGAFSAADRTREELAEILNNAKLYEPTEDIVKEIRNENDDHKMIEEFRNEISNGRIGFEDNKAAKFLYDVVYRDNRGESTLCCSEPESQIVYYLYGNGIWKKTFKYTIKFKLQSLLNKAGYSYKNNNIQSVLALFQSYCFVSPELFNSRHDLINLGNCAYNLKTFIPVPHNPKHYFTFKNDYDYDETAICPVFDKTLKGYSSYPVQNSETGKTVMISDLTWIAGMWEIFGLSLTSITSFQKMFFLYGAGGMGKGTLLRILDKLVGFERTKPNFKPANVDGRFSKVALINKHLAITGDLPAFMANIDSIKELTGEDRQSTDRKFKGEIDFVNTAKYIFAMNTFPEFPQSEDLGSILRRIYLLEFANPIKKRSGKIEAELHAEMSGIFNKAIQGLKRLLDNDEFTKCVRGAKFLDSYMGGDQNENEAFFSKFIVIDPKAKVFIHAIWNAYTAYMDEYTPGWTHSTTSFSNPSALAKALNRHPGFVNHIQNLGTQTDYLTTNSAQIRKRNTCYGGVRLFDPNIDDLSQDKKLSNEYPPDEELDSTGAPPF
ncbi:MAG: hypothetical protein KAH48_04170 [Chlorobi bacterium]|nr:hypothetical protein [Chlorobiota bacterium]